MKVESANKPYGFCGRKSLWKNGGGGGGGG